MRNHEKEYTSDTKLLIECCRRLLNEHKDLSVSEVIKSYNVSGGTWDEGVDKNTIRKAYLSEYEDNIKKLTKDGFTGDIDKLTDDQREIIKFDWYALEMIDRMKIITIREFKNKYGEKFCLNIQKA